MSEGKNGTLTRRRGDAGVDPGTATKKGGRQRSFGIWMRFKMKPDDSHLFIQQKVAALEALKKSLLHQAFRGKF